MASFIPVKFLIRVLHATIKQEHPDQAIYILGNVHELGEWDTSKAGMYYSLFFSRCMYSIYLLSISSASIN
jgi:hypothetical protein